MDSAMMLSILPDLSPRNSHSQWYTSSRNPVPPHSGHREGSDQLLNANQRRNHIVVDRSPLARLHADELNIEIRKRNIADFGIGWLKPPGVPKTLYQSREDEKEHAEHQESLRREQAAAELQEAGMGGVDSMLDGQGDDVDGMEDVQLDGARDLDEDIPDADADFGLGLDSDDSDDEEDESDGEEAVTAEQLRAEHNQLQLMAQRMRQDDDPFRETPSHAGNATQVYGAEDEVDEDNQAEMIEEEDFVAHTGEMNMDADLDDDIPDAQSAAGPGPGYEHTDTEADMSSSEGETAEVSFGGRAPQTTRFRGSLAPSDTTRNSIAMSDLLSRDGTSLLLSSPQIPRQNTGAPSGRRHGHDRS